MSIPYYVSDEIKGWLKDVNKDDIESIRDVLGDTGLRTIRDVRTNIGHICGIITLKYSQEERPVLLVAWHVYDPFKRIYNKDFDIYYTCTGAIGVVPAKSKYFLTKRMLQFFVKEKIDFLPVGETMQELKHRRVVAWDDYYIGDGYLMS